MGFGENFEKGGWTFSSEPSRKNVERLSAIWRFQHATHSPEAEVSIFLNDGVARVYDITEKTKNPKSVLRWFVFACIHHLTCSHADGARGFPGLRGVMSCGERVLLGEESQCVSDYLDGSAEAHARFGGKVCVYSPKEAQLNLAFSRAYIIESAGKGAGLEHPALYIDAAALDGLEQLLNNRSSLEGVVLSNSIAQVTRLYRVERRLDENAFVFRVLQESHNDLLQPAEFIFAAPGIHFSKRGIDTTLHRLTNLNIHPELTDGPKNVILESLLPAKGDGA